MRCYLRNLVPCLHKSCKINDILWDIKLSNVLPELSVKNYDLCEKKYTTNCKELQRQANTGPEVMYRNYTRGSRQLPGTVIGRKGSSSYQMFTKEGIVINRYINQLIRKKKQSIGIKGVQER